MTRTVCERIEPLFWTYLAGDYESVRWYVWLYGQIGILAITALVGYFLAAGRPLLSAALLPIPAFYVYRRFQRAGEDA